MAGLALDHPQAVLERLEEIDGALARKQNLLEESALAWFRTKRDREKSWAEVFIRTQGTVADRKAAADLATADVGWEDEGRWEALRASVRVLDTRASIGMSILRAQSRA
jgi:hypothetical protein